MRSLKYLLPMLVFLVIAGFLLLGLDRNPAEIPSPLIDKPAPTWSLPRLPSAGADADTGAGGDVRGNGQQAAGQSIGSQDLRGAPYLLNVWASWCAPCLQEHPQLIELHKRNQIRLVGINYKDKPEDARTWLARHGNPFRDVAADRDGRAAIDFGVYGVPETFLVDAQGVVRFKHIGAVTPEALRDKLLPAIARMAGPASATPQSSAPPVPGSTPVAAVEGAR
ncbi:MAG: DsbE family thiol:disulfide interchange protein [Lautropia sp.]